MPIIIDGYNLLRSIEKTCEDFGSNGDVRLCHILDGYLRSVGEKGVIVFDGIGPPDKSGFNNRSNLEIIFVGRSTDADSVIEDKISVNTAPKRLKVVSNDRRLRDAARRAKAISVKSEAFFDEVQKELGRKRGIKEPAGKRHGLTEGETDQWLEIFGLEQ